MLIVSDIPDIKQLDYVTTFNRTLKIFSREGYLIGEFGDKLRIPLKYNQIPKNLVYAFIAAEDEHFFEHSRSHGCKTTIFSRLIYGCKSTIPFILFHGRKSTIPYRLAKSINYKKWEVGEIGRAKRYLLMAAFIFRMKQKLSKQRIMQIYLNRIYLGNRAVGVQAAANVYYGTTVDKLTLAQIAMIAGLPKAPSIYNPINRPKRAKIRRNYVLRRMYDLNYITEKQYDNGVRSEITAKIHQKNVNKFEAGYVAEMSRLYMDKTFGHIAYRNGYSVYTSLSVKHQKWANNALRLALLKYDRRHGFRGAEDKKLIKTNITEKQKRKIMEKYTVIGGLIPGLVTEVHDKSVNVYLLGGKNITLNWKAIKWARKYISTYQKGRPPTEANKN